MRIVLETMKHKAKDKQIYQAVEYVFEAINVPDLQNCFLKSFKDYPFYNQVRKETVSSARNAGKQHYKLNDYQVSFLVAEKLEEVEKEIEREAHEYFRMLKAKLSYSKKLQYLLNTKEFEEVEHYVRKS